MSFRSQEYPFHVFQWHLQFAQSRVIGVTIVIVSFDTQNPVLKNSWRKFTKTPIIRSFKKTIWFQLPLFRERLFRKWQKTPWKLDWPCTWHLSSWNCTILVFFDRSKSVSRRLVIRMVPKHNCTVLVAGQIEPENFSCTRVWKSFCIHLKRQKFVMVCSKSSTL